MKTCTTTDRDTATARPVGTEEVTRLGTNLTAPPSASAPASSLHLHSRHRTLVRPTPEHRPGRHLHRRSGLQLRRRPQRAPLEGRGLPRRTRHRGQPPQGTHAKKVARPEPSCLARRERRSTCSSTGRGQRREVRAWGGELGAELSVRDTKAFRADQHLMRDAGTWSARPSVSIVPTARGRRTRRFQDARASLTDAPPVEFPVSTRANVKRLVEKP